MNTDLSGLRHRAGATQVELDAWEHTHGCSPRDPRLIKIHNELLRQNQESKDWLMIAEANLSGQMNFTPTLKKTK